MLASTRSSDSDHPPPRRDEPPRAARSFKPTVLRRSEFYFSSEELAYAWGVDVQRARRRLRNWGLGIKRGRHYRTTRGLILRCLPDEGAELIALLEHIRRGGQRPKVGKTSLGLDTFYVPLDVAAQKLGWEERRLRRRVQKTGGAVKRGGRWYVSRGVLRRVIAEHAEGSIAEIEWSEVDFERQ